MMFAVLFEVNPKPEQWDTYLGYTKMLRPELVQMDGFIDNERFSSLLRPGWMLSLSTWQDENEVFREYHIRIGEITSDDRLAPGEILRERRFDETRAPAKLVALSEAELSNLPPSIRHRRVRVIRDYGMFDGTEAPQYYPPVLRES